jgi:hypothetical protein
MTFTDVFISYSRKDSEFVKRLHESLIQFNQDVWIDWEDIPLSAEWEDEIKKAIEGASTFICIISPDFVLSQICQREVEYANKSNKRIIPILHREVNDSLLSNSITSKINWIFFRETVNF